MAQSTLSNKLRLLRLPEEIRRTLEQEQLTERHARALLRLETTNQMKEALDHIALEKLNVSQSEKLIEQLLKNTDTPDLQKKQKKAPIKLFKDVRLFINTLNHAVDTMKRAGISADSSRKKRMSILNMLSVFPKTVKRSSAPAPTVHDFPANNAFAFWNKFPHFSCAKNSAKQRPYLFSFTPHIRSNGTGCSPVPLLFFYLQRFFFLFSKAYD